MIALADIARSVCFWAGFNKRYPRSSSAWGIIDFDGKIPLVLRSACKARLEGHGRLLRMLAPMGLRRGDIEEGWTAGRT